MPASLITRGAVIASCSALAWAWVCAGSAEAAEVAGFTVGGTSVTLASDASHGTPLKPGRFGLDIPAQSGTWYATVTRHKGERLQVGTIGEVTWDTGPYALSSGNSQDLTFSLETADGVACQSNDIPIPAGTRRGAMFNSLLVSDPNSDERVKKLGQDSAACRDATSFRLSIKRSVAGGQNGKLPTQISVVTAPAVKGDVSTPTLASTAAITAQPGTSGGKITPASGFQNAPTVESKSYSVDAVPGAPMIVKVHLAPGQRLATNWQLPSASSPTGAAQDLNVETDIYAPDLGRVTLGSKDAKISPSTTGSVQSSAYTAPVDFGNVDLPITDQQAELAPAWSQTDPGWYYVLLSAVPDVKNKNDQTLKSAKPIPSTLSVQVTGAAGDGPRMSVAQPKAGRVSGDPTGSRVKPAVWGGLAALGVLGVVAAAVLLRRRSARAA